MVCKPVQVSIDTGIKAGFFQFPTGIIAGFHIHGITDSVTPFPTVRILHIYIAWIARFAGFTQSDEAGSLLPHLCIIGNIGIMIESIGHFDTLTFPYIPSKLLIFFKMSPAGTDDGKFYPALFYRIPIQYAIMLGYVNSKSSHTHTSFLFHTTHFKSTCTGVRQKKRCHPDISSCFCISNL